MLHEMKQILHRDGAVDEDALKRAAAYMMQRQFIYRSDASDRPHYLCVSEYRTYFEHLFDALGYRVVVDDDYSFIGIIPESFFRPIKTTETLFLLIARLFYDEEIRDMQAGRDVIVVSYDAFMDRYEQLTGRARIESRVQMNDLIGNLNRFNVMKRAETDERVPIVQILPGIIGLISPPMIKMIGQFNNSSDAENEDANEEA